MNSTHAPLSARTPAETVVVIDDDVDTCETVSDLLGQAGYQTVSIRRSSVALAYLCQNPPPAVVLVDLLMPEMNAWELIAQMKRRDGLAKVPVIAMTGLGREWGAPVPEAMVLRKPIDSERLLGLVRTAVESGCGDAGRGSVR
jgi:CheY-like chemotaxis protein